MPTKPPVPPPEAITPARPTVVATEAKKYDTPEEFVRATTKKQKALVDDLIRQSKKAFAKSEEITGTAKVVEQNERYIRLGMKLKNRAVREERKLLNQLNGDKLTDIWNKAQAVRSNEPKGKELKWRLK